MTFDRLPHVNVLSRFFSFPTGEDFCPPLIVGVGITTTLFGMVGDIVDVVVTCGLPCTIGLRVFDVYKTVPIEQGWGLVPPKLEEDTTCTMFAGFEAIVGVNVGLVAVTAVTALMGIGAGMSC